MALDGSFLRHIKYELEENLNDARVDKIHQPAKEQIVISLRQRGGSKKLLISVSANTPRIHFTEKQPENPKKPSMFCMLLRKHIGGAKVEEIKQFGLDRIIHIIFKTTNELGDSVKITLAIEIMGRHSNIILIGNDGRIIDAIKRIDITMSSVRQVLSGMEYILPPAQDKLNLLEASTQEIIEKIIKGRDVPLSKAILYSVEGVSPVVCREISYHVTDGFDMVVSELTQEMKAKLIDKMDTVINTIRNHCGIPTIVYDKNKKPLEFSFIDIKQYENESNTKTFDYFSNLLDCYYTERDTIARMHSKSIDILKLVTNIHDRTSRKLQSQREEIKECKNRDNLKEYGDLLSSNIYNIKKGDKSIEVQNYYDEALPIVKIELNPRFTPSQNIQKYYQEYRKADTAEKKLTQLIKEGEQELLYIESVLDSLARATKEDEITSIREELSQEGYLKKHSIKNKKPVKMLPKKFISDDGFTILVGRNNIQNDQLTLKQARKDDVWFHTKDFPGSHTIVVTEGKDVPNETLTQAAIIAATNSKGVNSALVPVDYTKIKNVKKPNGAKPGMVIYEVYQTAFVNPDKGLCERLSGE